MKASDYIAAFLDEQGVTHVFELVGGMITHMLDSLNRQGRVSIVSMHHEQAAAFAAEGFGRMKGVPGVAMATSGPGATNLLTAIGSCYFDSTPAVFITGQVNRSELRGARPVRQLGFQETDIVSMALPITKASWRVDDPEDIPSLLAQAFSTALSGRPGPVLLDIPMDLQRADISIAGPPHPAAPADARGPDPGLIRQMLNDLRRARRPIILAGGGLRSGRAVDLFREFVHRVQAPVVHSLLAVDALPAAHPLRMGMIGSYGNRWANLAMGRSDFVLVLGSRLDIRQTGSETDAWKSDRLVYHVDVEEGEINNRVRGCIGVTADLPSFLQEALQEAANLPAAPASDWPGEISDSRRRWPDTAEQKGIHGINPNELMHSLSALSSRASAYVVDVGLHQMWAAQSLELTDRQRFLTSGGMGSMGFALPAAIGAAFAEPGAPLVVIAGDGGFQVNIQELQTVVRNGLPLKMVVINNRCLGMVRQFQQSYFDGRYQSTLWGYSAPDFAVVADAYGIESASVNVPAELQAGLSAMWRDDTAPFLLQVMIDTHANAYPKIAFGLPMTEMEPFAKPLEMEGT
jgi:acetolactate synthase I/II/III large subunit